MRLLVLGGTGFIGPAYLDGALARGWDVTAFNRGSSPAPDGVRVLRGDRTAPGGLAEIETGEWDIVVDTWSGAPSAVRDAARSLRGRARTYVYVSSCSAYADGPPAGSPEDSPLAAASPDDGEVDYQRSKAGGELAAVGAFGEQALLLRVGLILGPRENIGRLPWWLNRIARGGPVLAPGPRDLDLQFIDARDLAEWSLDVAGQGLGGAFNVASPPAHTTMGELLETCAHVTGGDAELRWTDPDKILAAGVRPWMDLPVWLPPGDLHDTMQRIDVGKAVAAGLAVRPAAETVADTWAWLSALGGRAPQRPDRPVVGLDPEVEAALLSS